MPASWMVDSKAVKNYLWSQLCSGKPLFNRKVYLTRRFCRNAHQAIINRRINISEVKSSLVGLTADFYRETSPMKYNHGTTYLWLDT
jgi:hypothetical protein